MPGELTTEYDVIIIGASMTGASLAYALGNAGVRTALIDKKTFPRWKPCGEGLSNIATTHLRKIGLLETVLNLPHTKIPFYRIHIGPLKIKIPVFGFSKTFLGKANILGINRSELDFSLISRAIKTNSVEFFDDEHILSSPIQQGLINTSKRSVTGKYVVIAAGNNHSFKENYCFTQGKDRFGLSTHLTLANPHNINSVEIITKKHLQLFITPISTTKINLSALGSQKEIKALAQDEFKPAIEFITKEFGLGTFQTSKILGAGPFGRRADKRVSGKTILLGDAYESLDPVGGMGMTQGIISASTLADALISIVKKGVDPDFALKNWESELTKKLSPLKAFTGLVALVLDKFISCGRFGFSNFKADLDTPEIYLN